MTGGEHAGGPGGAAAQIVERAHAKVNLVLRIGPPRPDGLHALCSLFAALELHDEVIVAHAAGSADEVRCPGVDGENLASRAIAALRAELGGLAPLSVEIRKRIPIAAGLAGGSADAAAVLRAGNALAGAPLEPGRLRAIAQTIGSDVPSQVEPAHSVVTGVGERVEQVHLPSMSIVLVPQDDGLATAAVYGELDRLGRFSADLAPAPIHALAAGSREVLAAEMANDLQPAALSLRPELAGQIERLRALGAEAAQVSGSGPTVFGVFGSAEAARAAAAELPGAIATELLEPSG